MGRAPVEVHLRREDLIDQARPAAAVGVHEEYGDRSNHMVMVEECVGRHAATRYCSKGFPNAPARYPSTNSLKFLPITSSSDRESSLGETANWSANDRRERPGSK